ncbi:hypothetical protein [Leptolyngbya sp. FACHB-17]|uniref:hypothetical protein n=1 Tax=unclassified Leptolyngbya TaxID=2650499 RepID=UPI0016818EE1|nr:hypothetical protein [Leptolyngbya sp. FACHB-17]MBD2079811.1 hypothetical protein [Leptolyngbya sp. FACHB-17]
MRHQPSWVRYGLARLRPIGRPVVWAPAIALLFLVLFTWEFFSRTEVARELESPAAEGTLSPEDRAIGADIDSLSLLMNDIKAASRPETAQFLIAPTAPTATPQNAATPNRLFSTPTDAIAQSEPEIQETTGTLRSASSTELGLPYTTRPATTETALPPNRLQEALTKLATENRSIVSQPPIEGTIRLDTPNIGTSINAAPQNSFSALIEGTQPIVPGTIPTVSAPLPIAPAINAPAINAPVASPVAPQALTPQPVETQNFGVMQNAPVVNQQPFSVPRSIPGRTIGGGNINTFSNP